MATPLFERLPDRVHAAVVVAVVRLGSGLGLELGLDGVSVGVSVRVGVVALAYGLGLGLGPARCMCLPDQALLHVAAASRRSPSLERRPQPEAPSASCMIAISLRMQE